MKLKCLKCNDIIESQYRHDFVRCSCGTCFIDGGKDYSRYGYEKQEDIELIYEEE